MGETYIFYESTRSYNSIPFDEWLNLDLPILPTIPLKSSNIQTNKQTHSCFVSWIKTEYMHDKVQKNELDGLGEIYV